MEEPAGEEMDKMHVVRAKRREEEQSNAPERRQQVVTESQLAMLQAQFFSAESERIQSLADVEAKRQAEVRAQLQQEWEEQWQEENEVRKQKDEEVAQKRAQKERTKQELRRQMDEAKARRRALEDEEEAKFRKLQDDEEQRKYAEKDEVVHAARREFEEQFNKIQQEQVAKENDVIRQHEEQIRRLRDEVRAKILERFQLKPEQVVPDAEAAHRSEDWKKSVIDNQSLSIIEPNQKYYDSKIDINLNQTQLQTPKTSGVDGLAPPNAPPRQSPGHTAEAERKKVFKMKKLLIQRLESSQISDQTSLMLMSPGNSTYIGSE